MQVNTERRSTLKASWILLLSVAAGGFGYSLGFQNGQSEGQYNATSRLDFVTSRLRESQERLQMEQEEEAEASARHPANGRNSRAH
jgi:hypothetical protein